MIKLICDNKLLYETISSYLLQKNLLLSSNENYSTLIKIRNNEKTIMLDINGHEIEISLPIDVNLLKSQILKKIIGINLYIGEYKYFPYQRKISSQNKTSLLSDIQNLIISNLILNNEGINKDHLYYLIWKNDKSIYINKLDTHLTNLKKKLNQELNLKVNFQSQNKTLRLLID